MRRPDLRAGLLSFAVPAALSSCAGAKADGRDIVPESRDVRVMGTGGASMGASSEGYDYVAKRPLAVVALAEARGIDSTVARAAIERLADALDTCVTGEGRRGTLVDGAARVVAQIDTDGTVAATSLRVDPGPGAAENAVLCLVAPIRLLSFPVVDAGVRGMAVEALWGRVIPRR